MSKKKNSKKFFDLSSREQKKVVRTATREANAEQQELVRRYERKFGRTEKMYNSCCE